MTLWVTTKKNLDYHAGNQLLRCSRYLLCVYIACAYGPLDGLERLVFH